MLPSQAEIEIPLLNELVKAGGAAKPKDLYPCITAAFPDITEEDLAEQLASGHSRWTNRIQWVRQKLVNKGQMSSPSRGVWAITDEGRARVSIEGVNPPVEVNYESLPPPADVGDESFLALFDAYETGVRSMVLDQLRALSAHGFERFAGALLDAYGFREVHVTKVGPDGGLDGHGKLRVGLAWMNVAFQCKKWENNISRPDIDAFRGAIQGEFEQGVFFTTASFSKPAREASIKPGAVPIVLLDGESIVRLMIEKSLGIARRPLYVYDVNVASVVGEEVAED